MKTTSHMHAVSGAVILALAGCGSPDVSLGNAPKHVQSGGGSQNDEPDGSTAVSSGGSTSRGGSTSSSGGSTSRAGATSSGGTTSSSGGSTSRAGATSSGGTTSSSGGSTSRGGATSSGGTTSPSGGSTGSSGATSAGGSTGPNCAVIGCGAPPICGQACNAPCGCCTCGPDDYILVSGGAYQCSLTCYSPATYSGVDIPTDTIIFAIDKKDLNRNVCYRLVLGPAGSPSPTHTVTRPNWRVASAWKSKNPSDCDSALPVLPADATLVTDATGSVLQSSSASGECHVDVNVEMLFDQGATVEREAFIVSGLPLPLADCN